MEIENKIPVIIDCDPGVDDSFAIALAHSFPEFDIKAITPVSGNMRAEIVRNNALGLRELFGINCRVSFGADRPLQKTNAIEADYAHGETGVGTYIFPAPVMKEDTSSAWETIYEEAVKADGKLILIATGPLTDIALCLRSHPDLPKLISRFYIMGGGTFGNMEQSQLTAEFNIWTDPEAAEEVFSKMEVWVISLDATTSSALTCKEMDEMANSCGDSPQGIFLRELTLFLKSNYLQRGKDNIIHDALAIASVKYPSVVEWKNCQVTVATDPNSYNYGQTIIVFDDKASSCHFAAKADQPLFLEILKNMCHYYQ